MRQMPFLRRLLFFISLVPLMSTTCCDEPGEYNAIPNDLAAWAPYVMGQQLVYEDSLGSTDTLLVERYDRGDMYQQEKDCDLWMTEEIRFRIVRMRDSLLTFDGSARDFQFELQTYQIHFRWDTRFEQFVTEDFPEAFHAELSLGGQTYSDVIHLECPQCPGPITELYYGSGVGIIAYRDDLGTRWQLR